MSKIIDKLNKNILLTVLTAVSICFILPAAHGICENLYRDKYPRKDAVVEAVQAVSPAVVNISSEVEVRRQVNPFSGFGINPRFDSFFNDFFDHGIEQSFKRRSLGSGVIIDGKRGFILTSAHVIAETGTITITLKDERAFEAQVVGADPDSDLAVLKISAEPSLPAIEMGNSDDLMIGETVIAIGNPFGFSNTVTTGVISAVSRSIKAGDRIFHEFIQTDASINPGNSGGPLLNINGELIGINTAVYADAQGIGFAIPINKARWIISDLIQYGEVIPAWTGIIVQRLDKKLAYYLKYKEKIGVVVKKVEEKSPAAQAGIQGGDIILTLGGKKIKSIEDYAARMKAIAAGKPIGIDVWRKEQVISFKIKTKAYPMENAMALSYSLLGIKVKTHQSGQRRHPKGAGGGVVITELDPGSFLAGIGVAPGDIIRQMGEFNIVDTEDFKKAIVKYRQKKYITILLQRGGQGYYITVEL